MIEWPWYKLIKYSTILMYSTKINYLPCPPTLQLAEGIGPAVIYTRRCHIGHGQRAHDVKTTSY